MTHFALAANKVPSVRVSAAELITAVGATIGQDMAPDKLLPHFVGRAGTAAEVDTLNTYVARAGPRGDDGHRAELLGLILASPAFQMH